MPIEFNNLAIAQHRDTLDMHIRLWLKVDYKPKRVCAYRSVSLCCAIARLLNANGRMQCLSGLH